MTVARAHDIDAPHISSHWRARRGQNDGFGNPQAGITDWAGSRLLALTSPDRRWIPGALPPASEACRAIGLSLGQDTVRQLCTLALLRHHLPTRARVLIIGDGYGALGAMVARFYPAALVHMVDLSFNLEEQRARLTRAFGSHRFSFSHASEIEKHGWLHYDVAVNVASMQEMNPDEIARYFAFMRGRAELFYCCNRERKELPDGTVTEFDAYPWSLEDNVLLDEPCPWHQWYFSARLPLIRRYDGVIRHRLVRLAP